MRGRAALLGDRPPRTRPEPQSAWGDCPIAQVTPARRRSTILLAYLHGSVNQPHVAARGKPLRNRHVSLVDAVLGPRPYRGSMCATPGAPLAAQAGLAAMAGVLAALATMIVLRRELAALVAGLGTVALLRGLGL